MLKKEDCSTVQYKTIKYSLISYRSKLCKELNCRSNNLSLSLFPCSLSNFISHYLGDIKILEELLPAMIKFHLRIMSTNYDPVRKLYFNTDNRDGMEGSIGKKPAVGRIVMFC